MRALALLVTGLRFRDANRATNADPKAALTGPLVSRVGGALNTLGGSGVSNHQLSDVGTRKPTDNSGRLKSAPLAGIALTAPFLHDGSARTLEEIWTVYNPEDKHGRTNDLTKDELNDLIEYLRTR